MIKCPACGTENASGSNFCIACGIDLNTSAAEQRARTDSVEGPSPSEPSKSSSVDMPREYLHSPPPPPQPTPPAAPTYSPPPAAPQYQSSAQPTKDRTLPIVVEVIAGFFGFLGVGWILAGNVTTGLILMVGFWVGHAIAFVLDLVTVGLFTCIHVPAAIAAIPVSAYFLHRYTKNHPEVFGP